MDGAGMTKSILLAGMLAAGIAGSAGVASAQAPPVSNSWEPIAPEPATPAQPDQQSPPRPSGEIPAKAWAPPELVAPPQAVGEKVCGKSDFEAVVDEAAGALRDLNMQNKPTFQEKLRQLKDKRGWSHDAFLKEAAPYVRDDKIAVYDQESERLLSDISSLGQEGADAPSPDCTLLAGLKGRMKTLVDTQSAKWSYMFQKLDAALAQ